MNFYFLIRQKMALNQRSGVILEVQIQNFGALAPETRHSFHFQKIPRGLNINIFLEKLARGFLLHFFSFKNYFFYPEKAGFWFLKKNPPKNCLTPK